METLLQTFVSDSGFDDVKARATELRSLEAYRLRLEHEERVADELARIDVLARRLSSRPPPALASIPAPMFARSAPPPAMSSSQLPFGDASSGSWPALSMDVVAPEERLAAQTPARLSLVMVAVAVSVAVLSFAGLAFVLGPSSPHAARYAAATQPVAQMPTAQMPAAQMPAQTPATQTPVAQMPATQTQTCAVEPRPAVVAVTAPVARTTRRASHAARTAPVSSPSPTPNPAATAKTSPTPDMDQAARTAQMLREQLGTSLR